jgi:hypothetical protein
MLVPKSKYVLTARCGKCSFQESKNIEVETENLGNAKILFYRELAAKHKDHLGLNDWNITEK